jgi:hypothetical protein
MLFNGNKRIIIVNALKGDEFSAKYLHYRLRSEN